MESGNKYSIILPTYNERDNIAVCIYLINKYLRQRFGALPISPATHKPMHAMLWPGIPHASWCISAVLDQSSMSRSVYWGTGVSCATGEFHMSNHTWQLQNSKPDMLCATS
jgi:hypothetical protein